MNKVSSVGLFCDDVRPEISGQQTIVGVYGDNLALSQIPGALPKLGFFVRVNFEMSFKFETLSHKLMLSNGTLFFENNIDADLIKQSINEAREVNSPIYGFKTFGVAMNFPVESAGRLNLFSVVDGTDYLAATLNFSFNPAVAPTA